MKRCLILILVAVLLTQCVLAVGGTPPTTLADGGFANVEVAADVAADQITFSGSISGTQAQTVAYSIWTATGKELSSGAASVAGDGSFKETIELTMQAGDAMVLQLEADGLAPYQQLFTAQEGPAPEKAVVSDLRITSDLEQQRFQVTGQLTPAGQQELTILVTQSGSVAYLDQFMTEEDGSFALSFGTAMARNDAFQFQINGVMLEEMVRQTVTVTGQPMTFRDVTAEGDHAADSVYFAGYLDGAAAGETIQAVLETATGKELWTGTVETEADGAFSGEIAVTLDEGDALVLRLTAEGAEPSSTLFVVPGSGQPELAEITEVTITPDVAAQRFTITGKTAPAGVRELTMMLTRSGSIIHIDQFTTEADGSFTLTFGADMQAGDTFVLQLNGALIQQPFEQSVTIAAEDLVFTEVQAAGDSASGMVTYSGRLAGAAAGTEVQVRLTTATGKELWSGAVQTDETGAFRGEIAVELDEGDALVLCLTAENAEPSNTLFVVPGGTQPEPVEITELTITPDVDAQRFTVTGKTEPAGVRDLTMLVTKAGSVVHADQFTTREDGSFTMSFAADMQDGDIFIFQIGGAQIATPVRRTVEIKDSSSGGGTGGGGGGSVAVTYHYAFLNGYGDGTFHPDSEITRAEVAMVFARLLSDKYVFSGDYTTTFPDVDEDMWYADCIGFLESKGIVKGDENGEFRPDDPITRAEFATMTVRLQNLTEDRSDSFPDVPASHWAYGYIGQAAANGWINGYGDGTFRPENDITRAEAVSLLHRMLGRTCTMEYVKAQKDWKKYPDVSEQFWAYLEIMCATNEHTH